MTCFLEAPSDLERHTKNAVSERQNQCTKCRNSGYSLFDHGGPLSDSTSASVSSPRSVHPYRLCLLPQDIHYKTVLAKSLSTREQRHKLTCTH
eukprot:3536690-Amphidinium_carterae.1